MIWKMKLKLKFNFCINNNKLLILRIIYRIKKRMMMDYMEYLTNYKIKIRLIRKKKLILELSVDFCKEILKILNSRIIQQ
jgi:hypothetical protein